MSVGVVRDEHISVEQSEKVYVRDCKDVVLVNCIVSRAENCIFEKAPVGCVAPPLVEPPTEEPLP